MAKFSSLFVKETPAGRKALAQIKNLKVGDILEEKFMPSLPANAFWKCVEAAEACWKIEGSFCGIKFVELTIRTDDNVVTLNVRETE